MSIQTSLNFDIRSAYKKADVLYSHVENLDYKQALEVIDRNLLALSDSDFMVFTWGVVKCKVESKNGKPYGKKRY